MCTIILAHRQFEGAPLVVAANRDEFLARPASGPGCAGVNLASFCLGTSLLLGIGILGSGVWLT